MPTRLTPTQRAARAAQTYSRPEANGLVQKYRQPFLHAGGERYVMLGDALQQAGLEPALELVQDRRSLLLWPDYKYGQPFLHAGGERYVALTDALLTAGLEPTLELVHDRRSVLLWPTYVPVGQATLAYVFNVARTVLSEGELAGFAAERPMIDHFADLPAGADASPAGTQARELAQTLHALTAELRHTPDLLSTVPRRPEDVGRLLTIFASAVAVLAFEEGRPEAIHKIRRIMANIINDPVRFLRTTTPSALDPVSIQTGPVRLRRTTAPEGGSR